MPDAAYGMTDYLRDAADAAEEMGTLRINPGCPFATNTLLEIRMRLERAMGSEICVDQRSPEAKMHKRIWNLLKAIKADDLKRVQALRELHASPDPPRGDAPGADDDDWISFSTAHEMTGLNPSHISKLCDSEKVRSQGKRQGRKVHLHDLVEYITKRARKGR